jgi:hypothetical protein
VSERRGWIARHASAFTTAVSGAVIVAVVATIAVVSGGYTAQRMDLGDAAVWVANADRGYVGRANTEVHELNSAVQLQSRSIDLVQEGAAVIAVDATDARADIVDPVTSTVSKTVALPPDQPEVLIAGDTAAVYSGGSGELWISTVDAFSAFDAETQATLNLGAGSIVSIDDRGVLYAYTPSSGQVRRVDVARGASSARVVGSDLELEGAGLQLTSVGSHWALLDPVTGSLIVDGTPVDLSGSITPENAPVLQTASSHGDGVLLATSTGLFRVPFEGTAPEPVVANRVGDAGPAAPLVSGECVFGAWRDGTAVRLCADAAGSRDDLVLADLPAGAVLGFRSNGSHVVLNDSASGAAWAVQDEAQTIDNWDDLIDEARQDTEAEENDPDSEVIVEKNQKPPVALADEFGARPGRSTVMPVLLNDYDPNGDVLAIDSVSEIDPAIGRIDIVGERQQVQITLADAATSPVQLRYTVSDGRGGTADAEVTVGIRSPGENEPPRQARTTRLAVGAGGQATVAVLGDWVDPDGDAMYVVHASVPSPDAVTFSAGGNVTMTASPSTSGSRAIALSVSDGSLIGSGGVRATVIGTGDVPLVADPFVALAYSGQEITVSPLDHVHGGDAPAQLNSVPVRQGSTITPNYSSGTFRFTSDEVRTHYLTYVVTDGVSTVTGTVRVDVSAAPDPNSPPVTVPKTVFVYPLSSGTVEVATTDIDPAGGVLLVTGTSGVDAASPVTAQIIAQRAVRVTLTAALAEPLSFRYTVTNGYADAQGRITVVEIPAPVVEQTPIARDDIVTARVGDVINIPVLENDEQPDGLDLTLDERLVENVASGSGLAFVSGTRVRYLAPTHPGNFSLVYQVRSPSGAVAQAEVRIQVREVDAASNTAPVAAAVEARTQAGRSVRIEIPLDGDPDGDSVQLIGQSTNPQKGAVTATGADWLEYTAGDYSVGTDQFEYAVTDALGARATGTVRVGIGPREGASRNPVAVRDDVVARPGTTVSVQVLVNDSDPDGGVLRVVAVQPTDDVTTAEIVGDAVVDVTPPSEPGTYSVLYTVENETGVTGRAFVTVRVDPDAPLSYPIANDTVLALADVLGRNTVTVDVLAGVFFADGPERSLVLSVLSGYEDVATVTDGGRIAVKVRETSQIIPFAVAHPLDRTVRSYAFIRVPGSAFALPQLDADAPALIVRSGEPLTIELPEHVVVVGGRAVRLTDSSSVQATHADGENLVVDADTLRYTSDPSYSGPASISFEVTDAAPGVDSEGRETVLVLPIVVQPRENAPPVFRGAVLEFEPGENRDIDLTRLTDIADTDSAADLRFAVTSAAPADLDYELTGSTLELTARAKARVGASSSLTVAVSDADGTGRAGTIQVSIVASTRPLAQPAADSVVVRRGGTADVDVLANDESTNPFPETPLRVVSFSGLDDTELPPGVTVRTASGGSRLVVVVSQSAEPGDTVLRYVVADASGAEARYASATVRISVQDVPDAPAAPVRQLDSFVGGELRLRFSPPAQNNSPLTGYRVVSSSHGNFSQDCGSSVLCTIDGLTVGLEYRFSVIAINEVGESAPSPLSAPYTIDYRPAAPGAVSAVPSSATVAPAGGSITVTWSSVPDPDPGTPVSGYTVVVSGPGVDFSASATSPFVTTAQGALKNDVSYTVQVFARNGAQVQSSADWHRTTTTVRTVGPPSAPSSGPAVAVATDGRVRVTWGTADGNGAAQVSYSVGRLGGDVGAPPCLSGTGKPGERASGVSSGWTDDTAEDGETYTYVVYVDNGVHCTAAAARAIESKRPPGAASASVAAEYHATGQFDVRVRDLAASGIVRHYEYRLGGGAWSALPGDGWLTSVGDPSYYGTPVSVALRACRDETQDYCGEASPEYVATPVDVRAGVTSCVVDSRPVVVPPINFGAASVSYALSYNDPVLVLPGWSDFSYTENDPVPSGSVGVRVRATVTVEGTAYVDEGYGEAECG